MLSERPTANPIVKRKHRRVILINIVTVIE